MTMPRVSTAGIDAGQRRIAARHLLASPILTAARNPAELDLVRHHATALKSMFAGQLGYALVVESTFARLVKAPLPASAPVRAARRGAGEAPFTARTYVLLALACGALLAPGVGEQILISALVDQIRADAAEQAVTVTDGIGDRRQLVAALKLLVAWGVVTETDGTLTGWGERPEDEALLSINRALLIHLLPSPLHPYEKAEDTWASLNAEPPRRRLRQRLVENPAVFRAELPDDELDVLSRERSELARHLDENFGLVLEVRAEGALAYDPASEAGGLTDIDFPGGGSTKQAALLLLDELNAATAAAGQHGRDRWSCDPGVPRALDAGRLGARRSGHAPWGSLEGCLQAVAGHPAHRGREPAGCAPAGRADRRRPGRLPVRGPVPAPGHHPLRR